MNRTLIPWVKNPDGSQGFTWNPVTGCLNGCEYCYARKLANGRLMERYLTNTHLASYIPTDINILPTDPFYPRFWEDRLYEPCQSEKPKGIFVVDMGELFGDWVPKEWQDLVFSVIEAMPQHRFYLLTKQPQNLIKFSPFPDNCWVGVTATNWLMFSDALGHLATIEAKIKYLSFEPLLEEIKLDMLQTMMFPGIIDWVIIGSQTKPYKPPKIEWVQEIVRACDKAGIRVFLKNNLRPIIAERQKPFWYIDHFESHLRQEMPTTNV